MTWRFKVALPASWDGPVDVVGRVGRQALEKHVFHDLCMLSSHSVFSDAFSQMVGDTQRLYLQFYEAIYLWRVVVGVCWLRIIFEWHRLLGQL